jgi:hypothetical protein
LSGFLKNEELEGIPSICQLCHSPFKAEKHMLVARAMTNGYIQNKEYEGTYSVIWKSK